MPRRLAGGSLAPRCGDHSQEKFFEEARQEASGILAPEAAGLPRAVFHFFGGEHGEINQACGQWTTSLSILR